MQEQKQDVLSVMNEYVERGILGAMMWWPEGLDAGLFYCTGEDFVSRERRVIFEAIGELVAEKKLVDFTTAGQRAFDKSKGERAMRMIREEITACFTYAQHRAAAESYAKEVAEKGRLSRLKANAAQAARSSAQSVDEVTEMLQRAVDEARLPDENQPQPIGEVMQQRYDDLADEVEGRVVVARTYTGIQRLDHHGGMRAGELFVLGGRPSHGKTALAWQMAEHAARSAGENEIALMFSLEMEPAELAERSFARATGLAASEIRAGRIPDDAWEPMHRTVSAAQRLPLYVVRGGTMQVEEINAICARAALRRRIKLVVVDYLQLVRSKRKHESREKEISFIARELKAISKASKTPVLALSQLSREVEKRNDHEPQSSDLKESGDIEAAADTIIFCWRPYLYDQTADETEMKLKTTKNRHGGIGSWGLRFLVEQSRFVEAA